MSDYKFIKITNNDNHKMFYIEVTKMQDIRIRVGILFINFIKHLEENKPYKEMFKIFESDYSFYCCYRCKCENYEEVKATKDKLYAFYNEKMKDYVLVPKSNILTF